MPHLPFSQSWSRIQNIIFVSFSNSKRYKALIWHILSIVYQFELWQEDERELLLVQKDVQYWPKSWKFLVYQLNDNYSWCRNMISIDHAASTRSSNVQCRTKPYVWMRRHEKMNISLSLKNFGISARNHIPCILVICICLSTFTFLFLYYRQRSSHPHSNISIDHAASTQSANVLQNKTMYTWIHECRPEKIKISLSLKLWHECKISYHPHSYAFVKGGLNHRHSNIFLHFVMSAEEVENILVLKGESSHQHSNIFWIFSECWWSWKHSNTRWVGPSAFEYLLYFAMSAEEIENILVRI